MRDRRRPLKASRQMIQARLRQRRLPSRPCASCRQPRLPKQSPRAGDPAGGVTMAPNGVTRFCLGMITSLAGRPVSKGRNRAKLAASSGTGGNHMRMIAWGAASVVALFAALQPAAAQVRIGVLNDMSSLYSDVGGKGSVESAKMAAEDAGAVLGQPVDVVFADHQNKPDVGSSIARQWYDTGGVDVITDVPTSSVGLAVNEVSREKQKL